jgi:hypothetical protein|tara:strand:- start:3267 stop:4136 length:870 start_codon:yes stop_codon:yes gene_type:complete
MFSILSRIFAVFGKAIILVIASESIHALDQPSSLPPVNIKLPSELTVEEIIERAREASNRNGQGDAAFKFYRKASFDELDNKGNIIEKNSKTYRAFTDDRDQQLRKVNDRKATSEERYREYRKHQERQRRYLNKRNKSDAKKRNESLFTRNIDLFEDKFIPVLEGMEKVNDRDAFVIGLKPNKKNRYKSRTVNRIMDQLKTKVWIDKEEFQISQISARLIKPVNFLGGIAGAIKTINIDATQKRLGKDNWVDEKVNAQFNARIAWKTYQFRMESLSTNFERTERNQPES